MHEESIGLAAFDWFGGSVIKAIIMYVDYSLPQKHLLIRNYRKAADCTQATSFADAIVIVHRANAQKMYKIRVPWNKYGDVR